MKKFILVDPSFDGVTGDKWQYAVAFARSAWRNGYQFVLLSARTSPELPLIDGVAVDQRPIFSHAFYEHDKIVSRHLHTAAERASQRRSVAERALLRRIREEELRRAEEADDPGRKALALRKIALVERRAARAAAATESARANDADAAEPFNRDDFGVALAAELQRLQPGRGDVLFFHTMTPAMLESFSEVSLHTPGRAVYEADAYCLFHFGAQASDARTFLDRYHSYSHFGSLRARLMVGCPFKSLHLLATSEKLAQECEELLGMQVGLFHGLSNLGEHVRACGGEAGIQAIATERIRLLEQAATLRVAVRAGDLSESSAASLRRGVDRLKSYGITVDLRVLYHARTLSRLRDVLEWFGNTQLTLVDVERNDDYIVELARAHLVLLTYIAERYAKRVSAVLHDCAVLGTSCVVPAGTTMADAIDFADIYVYRDTDNLAATLLQAARALRCVPPAGREAKVQKARAIYGQDVVTAILQASLQPSLTVGQRGPVAVLFMPAWGRCGTSYVIEDQLRFLLKSGYFVVQILVMDKPVDRQGSIGYFWKLLHENSQACRGSVQRIAYATFEEFEPLQLDSNYLSASAFEQLLLRVAQARLRDPALVPVLAQAELALVNHVFNSRFAQRHVSCPKVLETHDIQSYQMHKWPLCNEATGEQAKLDDLLQDEMREIGSFDQIVNIAQDEHLILSLANQRATLVTPYVHFEDEATQSDSVSRVGDLVDLWGLSNYYRDVSRFQILLLGDSHPANRESAEWFIEKVYLPHLQPLGRTLVIAGRLSDALWTRFGTIPYVFYIGFVRSVVALRKLCDVNVLPDIRGTGISLKSLEAFACGQAFVSTSRALRGFSGLLPPGLLSYDDPKAFADRVDLLLQDEHERRAVQEMGLAAYHILANSDHYDQAWARITHDLNQQTTSVA